MDTGPGRQCVRQRSRFGGLRRALEPFRCSPRTGSESGTNHGRSRHQSCLVDPGTRPGYEPTEFPGQVVGNQAASTDMGNVSQLVPSIHPMMSIDSLPAVNHQAEFAAASVSLAGDRAVVDAALVLASTAVDIATTPGAIDRIREEFAHPIPDSSLRL